jgi:hypothetical protein
MGRSQEKIEDFVVDAWIAGLPSSPEETIIVSLLGRKPQGLSEFSYYSFRGGFDRPEDRPGSRTWQEWLSGRYGSKYHLLEFPTVDTKLIADDTKSLIASAILKAMQSGKTVILVDSGGIGRTGNMASMFRKIHLPMIEVLMTPRCP